MRVVRKQLSKFVSIQKDCMHKHKISLILLVLIATSFMLQGCVGKVLNPYESNFSCEGISYGECSSTKTAYDKSKDHDFSTVGDVNSAKSKSGKSDVNALKAETKAVEDANTVAKLTKQTNLLRAPVTPLVEPPEVKRILILPYQDDDSGLYMARMVYYISKKPKFVIGDFMYKTLDED